MAGNDAIAAYDNVGGNYYDKYNTRNPVARRLMAGFLAAFDDLTAATGASAAFEVGCGEGHLSLRLLSRGLAVEGCDLEPDVIERANEAASGAGFGRPFFVQSIYDIEPGSRSAELVVCCEVLEHLPATLPALDRLAAMANPYLIVSVPREPVWRGLNLLRGKYLGELGNTPGHIQHWSSRAFVGMLRGSFDVIAVRRPLPWTMVLCRVRA